MSKNVELFVNDTKEFAVKMSEVIKDTLIKFGYNIVDKAVSPEDIVIGFGGDGTLLQWLSNTNYQTLTEYIGVNCGTLGFLQDFEVKDAMDFVINIPNYIRNELKFIMLEIINNDKYFKFYALNEFSLLNKMDKSFRCNINIGGENLEDYVGTGIIFSSPTGSTAHNISAGGSILYPGIEAIQITPREPIINVKFRSLVSSICIPKGIAISLTPNNTDEIKIVSDGRIVYEGNYEKINISYSNSYMVRLTNNENSFITKVREKLI